MARIATPRARRSRTRASAAAAGGLGRAVGCPIPDEAARAIRLEVSAEDDSGRRLLSESWPLDRTAGAYLKLHQDLRAAAGVDASATR